MFLHRNLKLLEPNGPVGDDDLDFLESAMVAAVTCDESGGRAELADAGCDADGVMHLARGTIATTTMALEKVDNDSGCDDE
jgi:hypothetical protein